MNMERIWVINCGTEENKVMEKFVIYCEGN